MKNKIDPADVTCIIPTSDTPDMLKICLATLRYYVPELSNVIVVGHDSNDDTAGVANQYSVQYINLNADQNRKFWLEHLDGVTFGLGQCETEWALLLHSDMEFTAPFWHYITELEQFDMLYAEPVKDTGAQFYSAPKSSFILARTNLFEESEKCGISLDSRADGDVAYDVFYDWWKWLEASGKTIALLPKHDFYIHYWGFTHYRKNPEYISNTNIQLYLEILDKVVQRKVSHISNVGLPFPENVQYLLLKILEKNASR